MLYKVYGITFNMAECQVQKKENHFLRVFTGIAMVFIALAHYYSKMEINGVIVNDVIYNVGRFVIPIFAMISGYFLFSKDGHSERNIKGKALHILLLIVFFKLFYLAFSTVLCIGGIVNADYVITEFLTVSPPFTFDGHIQVAIMTTQPIWFVYGLFLVYGLFYLLHHFKVDFKVMMIPSVLIMLAALIIGEFMPMFGANTIGNMSVYDVSGLIYPFIIIPFFTFGYLLHRNKERIDSWLTNRMILAAFLGSIVLMCIEAMLVPKSTIVYFGSVILAFAFFLGTFRLGENTLRWTVFEYIGRNMSAWMYVFFGFANFVVRFWMQAFAPDYVICEIIGPLLALALDIAMGFAMFQILKNTVGKKKKKKAPAEAPA